MTAVASVLPSLTTITSKSGVNRPATRTAWITRLAIVPASLYAGKKTLRLGVLREASCIGANYKPYHGGWVSARKGQVTPDLSPGPRLKRSRQGSHADS